jgi:hypothetical protein
MTQIHSLTVPADWGTWSPECRAALIARLRIAVVRDVLSGLVHDPRARARCLAATTDVEARAAARWLWRRDGEYYASQVADTLLWATDPADIVLAIAEAAGVEPRIPGWASGRVHQHYWAPGDPHPYCVVCLQGTPN